ncbi:MAG: flagellar export protein FliJ [Phycisphaerales bacterium]
MSKFVFPLQKVLELREREERDRRANLARFERARVQIEQRIKSHQAAIAQAKRDIGAHAMTPTGHGTMMLDMRSMRLQTNAALHLRVKAQMLVVRLAELNKDLDKARAELTQARQRRRAVEILKEKALEEWKLDRAKREANELDEINTVRAARLAAGHRIGA